MITFIFTLSSDRVLVIQAKDIREAMSDVEKNWYPNAFDDPFEVKIATGLSFKKGKEGEENE